MGWCWECTDVNNLQTLIEECKQQDPEMWEEAQEWVKDWSDKVKSGEVELDTREVYFREEL